MRKAMFGVSSALFICAAVLFAVGDHFMGLFAGCTSILLLLVADAT